MRIFSESVILVLLMVLVCSGSLFGSSIVVSDNSGSPGDTGILVKVSLSNSKPYEGSEIELKYNSTLLKLNRIEPASRLSNQSGSGYYEFTEGKVSLILFDYAGRPLAADSGAIFNAYFDIYPKSPKAQSEISISGITAVSSDLEYDTVAVTNGSILINPVSVEEPTISLPKQYSLLQNYPNPFNPATVIEYTLPKPSMVAVEIYNILGQKVRTLVNEIKPAGRYRIVWDGRNSTGSSVASGIYFYRIASPGFTKSKKMILLR